MSQQKRSFDTNMVVLGGRVGWVEGKQLEKSYLLRFTIATSDYKADGTEFTYWHTCNLWGKYGETMQNVIKKGVRICITGTLTSRSYEKDGEKRTSVEVNVNAAYPMAPRDQQRSSAPAEKQEQQGDPGPETTDEIPF
jgi:single-strand DNA-binding protein